MSLALTAGTWIFEVVMNGSCSTGTNGAQLTMAYSGTSTSAEWNILGTLNATPTFLAITRVTSLGSASPTFGTTSGSECQVRMDGVIVTTGAGNLTVQALKVTSQTYNIRAGSRMWAFKVA